MLMESPKSEARLSVVVRVDEHAVSSRGLRPSARFLERRACDEPRHRPLQERSVRVRAAQQSERASELGSALEKLGRTVEVAADRPSDLERILAYRPDFIFCDASISRIGGLGAWVDMLEQLLKTDARVPVWFVMVMGERERENEIVAREARAEAFGAELLTASAAIEPREMALQAQTSISLTDREKEVLTWAARGKTSADIATILGLKERTVTFHCGDAMKRLDVINRTHAVAKAVAEGLIGL